MRAVGTDTSCFYYYHAPTQTSSWKRPTLPAASREPVLARPQLGSGKQEDASVGSSAGVQSAGNARTQAVKEDLVNEDLPVELASTSPRSAGVQATGMPLRAVDASTSVDEETRAVISQSALCPLSPPPPRASKALARPRLTVWGE